MTGKRGGKKEPPNGMGKIQKEKKTQMRPSLVEGQRFDKRAVVKPGTLKKNGRRGPLRRRGGNQKQNGHVPVG